MKEETINNIGKPDKQKNDSKDSDVAHAAIEGNCYHCGKKGHKKEKCHQLKKEQKAAAATNKNQQTTKRWCDICYKEGHSTEWCSYNPDNKAKGKGSKGKQKEVKERAKVKVKAEKANLAKAEEAKATFQLVTSQTMHTWQRKIGNQPKKIGNQLMKIGN